MSARERTESPQRGVPRFAQALSEYRDGDLDADGDRRVAAHLRECVACEQEDREMAVTLAVLRERVSPRMNRRWTSGWNWDLKSPRRWRKSG